MSAAPGAPVDTGVPPTDPFRLVLPAGWLVDPLVVDRLSWQLSHAPAHIGAVVAPSGELRPGASYRTHAHHLALQPLASVTPSVQGIVTGAVLVRPNVEARAQGDRTEVDVAELMVDHGAHAHDPNRPIGTLRAASAWGRSPFPWRPSIMFVSLDADDPERLAWYRRLVNDLVELDIEARLAVPEGATEPTRGPHLTRPCLAGAGSLHALRPDVVAALDAPAVGALHRWAPDHGGRLLVLDPDHPSGVELDLAVRTLEAGPLESVRAGRFGSAVTAVEMATAIRRLCGVPRRLRRRPDEPAADRSIAVRTPGRRTRRPVAVRRSIAIHAGLLDEADERRVWGLAESFRQLGDHVRVLAGDESPPGSMSTDGLDLLVVHSSARGEGVRAAIDERRVSHRASVIDLAMSDLVVARDGDGFALELTERAAALLDAATLATTPSTGVAALLEARGLDHQRVPTLYGAQAWPPPADRAAAVTDVDPRVVIGWDVGAAGSPAADELGGVADELGALLDERPDLLVELTGDPTRVADALLAHPRVELLPERRLGPDVLDRWLVQLWTPHRIQIEVAGDLWPLVRAGRAGVPTIMAEHLGRHLVSAEPDLLVPTTEAGGGVRRRIELLADDAPRQRFLGEVTAERTRTEFGPAATFRALHRFVGRALATKVSLT